jgi:hypothetical protein
MNIFVLDECPIKAAQMQCDKHVVKMILETAQLLCSIFPNGEAPYKRTHYNHPCAKWTREKAQNYYWLIVHGQALCEEYAHRYGKYHKSQYVIDWCRKNIKFEMFPVEEYGGWDDNIDDHSPFPKCMPDDCKVEDVVQSYRNYYSKHKRHIAKWTKRKQPAWW